MSLYSDDTEIQSNSSNILCSSLEKCNDLEIFNEVRETKKLHENYDVSVNEMISEFSGVNHSSFLRLTPEATRSELYNTLETLDTLD